MDVHHVCAGSLVVLLEALASAVFWSLTLWLFDPGSCRRKPGYVCDSFGMCGSPIAMHALKSVLPFITVLVK